MKEIKDGMKDGMKDIDDDLKHALQREEPPAGFADRVLLRVAEPPQAEHRARTLPFQSWDSAKHRANTSGLAAERSRPGPFGPGITGGSKRSRPTSVFLSASAPSAVSALNVICSRLYWCATVATVVRDI